MEGHDRVVRHVHATRSVVRVAWPWAYNASAVEVAVRSPDAPGVDRDRGDGMPVALRGAQRLDGDLGARFRHRDRDADLWMREDERTTSSVIYSAFFWCAMLYVVNWDNGGGTHANNAHG